MRWAFPLVATLTFIDAGSFALASETRGASAGAEAAAVYELAPEGAYYGVVAPWIRVAEPLPVARLKARYSPQFFVPAGGPGASPRIFHTGGASAESRPARYLAVEARDVAYVAPRRFDRPPDTPGNLVQANELSAAVSLDARYRRNTWETRLEGRRLDLFERLASEEDLDADGIVDRGEDLNRNAVFDSRLALSFTSVTLTETFSRRLTKKVSAELFSGAERRFYDEIEAVNFVRVGVGGKVRATLGSRLDSEAGAGMSLYRFDRGDAFAGYWLEAAQGWEAAPTARLSSRIAYRRSLDLYGARRDTASLETALEKKAARAILDATVALLDTREVGGPGIRSFSSSVGARAPVGRVELVARYRIWFGVGEGAQSEAAHLVSLGMTFE